jgi:hypothetical protein
MNVHVRKNRFEIAVFTALAALTSMLVGTLLHLAFMAQVIA